VARVLERWQTGVILNWQSGSPETFEGPDMFYDNGVPDIVSPFPFKSGDVQWNGANNAAGTLHGGTYFGNPNPFIGVDDPQCAQIDVVDSMGYSLGAPANNNCTINALAHRNADGTPGQIIFQAPRPGTRGTAGRNTFFQRGEWDFDANISKTFRLTESKSLQLRIDTTNVLNHPEPADVEFDTTSGNFGLIPGQVGNTPGKSGTRSFQGSVRFTF
ncbi:MAG TPA: hypothetical protein VFR18_10610, partial [Terriglobia bacterium]|nr:hypothetical protein [Terriglobia bacterium]